MDSNEIAKQIAEQINQFVATVEIDETAKIDVVSITSAHSIDEDITREIKRIFGKKVAIEKKVDPSIIGGIILRVDNKIFDGSIKSQLLSLKNTLDEDK